MIDNSFKLDILLGTGGSSKVFSCYDPSGKLYAVKVVRKDHKYGEDLLKKMLMSEHEILSQMQLHLNILNSYSVNLDGCLEKDGKKEHIMYALIELANKGSLKTFVKRSGHFDEVICGFFFMQMLSALQFLHSQNYAHMDIKLENILLDEYYNIKLADLGTAVKINNSEGLSLKRCGTRQYMAPEITEGNRDEPFDAYKTDVYSLGVTLYVMLTGEFPKLNSLQSSEPTALSNEFSDELVPPTKLNLLKLQPHIQLSESCIDLLTSMLSRDSEKRLTLAEIFEHPWVQNVTNYASPSEVYLEMKEREEYIVTHFAAN